MDNGNKEAKKSDQTHDITICKNYFIKHGQIRPSVNV